MNKIIIWTPRVLTIIFILFVSMFALDAFEGNASFGHKLLGFGIHLVPSLLLIFSLIVAWKYPHIGAIFFLLLSLFFTFYFRTYHSLFSFLAFTVSLLFIALLFLWQWKKK